MSFRAESITWIGEPAPPSTIRPYKIKGSSKLLDNVVYWMTEDDYKLYLVEVKIIQEITHISKPDTDTSKLVGLIEEYADMRYGFGVDDGIETMSAQGI